MNAPLELACELSSQDRPLILALDQNGRPQRWIHWQQACNYYARNLVAWDTGTPAFAIMGGHSRLTGQRSCICANSIIAIRGPVPSCQQRQLPPPLCNRELFHRDRNLCAYCGQTMGSSQLTRDHILPLSRGGQDCWMNVVTACRSCNQRKGNTLAEDAGMQLLYAPYVPNRAEYLILSNRHILADQMHFLARHIPRHTRSRPD